MPGVCASLRRVPAVVFEGAKDAGELPEHIQVAEWRSSLHQGRGSSEESSQANSKSHDQADAESEPLQHCIIDAHKASQEEYSHIAQPARFSQ